MTEEGLSFQPLGNVFRRLYRLTTGKYEWVDVETGEVSAERYSWRFRWSLDGIHAYRWWWVRKYGLRSCGCTINPLTRRSVMFVLGCQKHGYINLDNLDD